MWCYFERNDALGALGWGGADVECGTDEGRRERRNGGDGARRVNFRIARHPARGTFPIYSIAERTLKIENGV
jgi:hypothetical protein